MVVTVQYQEKKILPVHISDKKARQSEIHKVIPEGCRAATLTEVALTFLYDRCIRKDPFEGCFAEELNGKTAIWVAHKGLRSSGCQEILEDGLFRNVDINRFRRLPIEKRSYHRSGDGLVMVGCHIAQWNDDEVPVGLIVTADRYDHLVERVTITQSFNINECNTARYYDPPSHRRLHVAYVEDKARVNLVRILRK